MHPLRRLYREKLETRMQTSRSYARDWICIHWKQIIEIVKVDLQNAVVQFGASEFLLQTAGIPQGSPSSVFLANLAASFLEYRAWTQAHSHIVEKLNQRFVHILRLRWVDDLFTIFVSENPLTDSDVSQVIDAQICAAYEPFGMKIENNREFVGLQVFLSDFSNPITNPGVHLCLKGRSRQEILSGAAKMPHAVSNTSKEKLKGYVKGSMMRALDSSSSEVMLYASLQGIFLETSSLCYPRTLFRHVFF